MEIEAKINSKIHNVDFIKILIMVTPLMQALLVAMLFRIIHPKYYFMKRMHLKTLTKYIFCILLYMQKTYREVLCPYSMKKLTTTFIYKHQP